MFGYDALKFDQARGEPESAKSLGDGDPDFAGQRVGDGTAGAQKVECGRLHALDGGDDMHPFVGEAGAVNVADEHGGAGLPLEIADAAAHGIDGKAKPFGRGAEAAAARDFQEHARSVPVLQTVEGDLPAFLLTERPFPTARCIQSLSVC